MYGFGVVANTGHFLSITFKETDTAYDEHTRVHTKTQTKTQTTTTTVRIILALAMM